MGGLENSKNPYCKWFAGKILWSEFPCIRHESGDIEEKGRLVDSVIKQMNEVLVEIAAAYNMRRPDFGINLFQSPANQQIMHEDLRSPLDCFHPTAKAHRVIGTNLWNSMLKPSQPTAFDDLPTTPACADEDTKLVTYNGTGKKRHAT